MTTIAETAPNDITSVVTPAGIISHLQIISANPSSVQMTTLDKGRDLLPSATNSLDVSYGMYVVVQTYDVGISQPNCNIRDRLVPVVAMRARVNEWMRRLLKNRAS